MCKCYIIPETAEAIRELTAGEAEYHEVNSVEEMMALMLKMATEW
ncbi:hypothetical protein [Actinobacillus porcitonsillarum]|nr:hypothetical protein [Actinobacillus porcitonsillarum]